MKRAEPISRNCSRRKKASTEAKVTAFRHRTCHIPGNVSGRSSKSMDKLLAFFLLCCSIMPPEASAAPPPVDGASLKKRKGFDGPFVGVNIGTSVSDLLSPSELAAFLKSQQIAHIRLYNPDAGILLALAGTHVRVALGVPNNQLLALGSSPATAAKWVSRYVTRFHPKTVITMIVVGDEVLTSSPSLSSVLVSAMEYFHAALVDAGISDEVKVSTSHSAAVILDPFPPSQAFFNQSLARTHLSPIIQFLANTSSPLMLNLYPYYVFMRNRGVVPIDNALFKPLPPSKEEVDPNTLLHYTNVLDAMIDAAYFSMKNLNVTGVPVLVGETGWPSKGDPKVEPFATKDNANTYNSNLIKRVLVDRLGTPLRPESTPSVYIYELFNEDLRSRPMSEANWGLFHGNGTPAYLLHVSGTGAFLANDTTNRTFCVVEKGATADTRTIQAALDWACGPGRADCSGIQPGEECYEPNNVRSHASYAFDSYYQKEGKAAGSCYFQGLAMITTTDPSHGHCNFPGRKVMGNSSSVAINGTQTSDALAIRSSGLMGTEVKGKRRGKVYDIDIVITFLIMLIAASYLT